MTRPEITDSATLSNSPSLTDRDVSSSIGSIFGFVLLSYLFSWTFWFLSHHVVGSIWVKVGDCSLEITKQVVMGALGDLGPGVAAIIVLVKGSGRRGVRQLLARVVPRNVKWLTLAILAPSVLVVYALVCEGYRTRELLNLASMETWLRLFAVNVFLSPFWEELGWRGYLLPRLEAMTKPLIASLAVGIIWAPWHAPLYVHTTTLGGPTGAFLLCFFIFALGLSVLFTWAYNVTNGDLAVLITLHTSFNASTFAFLAGPMAAAGMKPFYAVTLGIWLAALILVVLVGPDLSYRGVADCS